MVFFCGSWPCSSSSLNTDGCNLFPPSREVNYERMGVWVCVEDREMMSNASVWKPDCSSNWKRHRIVPVFSFYPNLWNSSCIWYLPLRHREPHRIKDLYQHRDHREGFSGVFHAHLSTIFIPIKVVVIMSHVGIFQESLGKMCQLSNAFWFSPYISPQKRKKKIFWKKNRNNTLALFSIIVK